MNNLEIANTFGFSISTIFLVLRNLILPINEILSEIKPGKILDLGCGYGLTTVTIARQKNSSQVVGLDLDNHRIKKAKQVFFKQKNVKFINMSSIRKLSNKQKFDTILVVDVLHHLSKEEQIFLMKNIKNHLKKDANLVIKDIIKEKSLKYFINFVHDYIVTKGEKCNYLYPKKFIQMATENKLKLIKTYKINSLLYPHIMYVFSK